MRSRAASVGPGVGLWSGTRSTCSAAERPAQPPQDATACAGKIRLSSRRGGHGLMGCVGGDSYDIWTRAIGGKRVADGGRSMVWVAERASERARASERESERERARGTRARRRGAGVFVAATRLGRDAHRRQDRRGAATSDDIGSAKNRGRSGPHTLRDEAWDSHRGGCRRTFEGPERACRDARRARA